MRDKEKVKAYNKMYVEKNKIKLAEKRKERYRDNRSKEIAKVSSYHKTKKGIVTTVYSAQKTSSKRRGYSMPSYSKEELSAWMLSQDKFHKLFEGWVSSGFIANLKPSVDRIDDYVSYTIDNIQITTWGQNNDRNNSDMKAGINNKTSKSVMFVTKGAVSKRFYSMSQASRETGVDIPHISQCCNGKRKYAGGYKWRFATIEILK